MRDTVNHPEHYGGEDNPYEAIKVIEAHNLGFCLGNAVKYILRAEKKGAALEDLKKSCVVHQPRDGEANSRSIRITLERHIRVTIAHYVKISLHGEFQFVSLFAILLAADCSICNQSERL